jgi:hypothetical protein
VNQSSSGPVLNRTDALGFVGDVSQLGGITRSRRVGGIEDGLEVITLRSGALEVEVLPGRGLDLGAARFAGQSLAWLSVAAVKRTVLTAGYGLSAAAC